MWKTKICLTNSRKLTINYNYILIYQYQSLSEQICYLYFFQRIISFSPWKNLFYLFLFYLNNSSTQTMEQTAHQKKLHIFNFVRIKLELGKLLSYCLILLIHTIEWAVLCGGRPKLSEWGYCFLLYYTINYFLCEKNFFFDFPTKIYSWNL